MVSTTVYNTFGVTSDTTQTEVRDSLIWEETTEKTKAFDLVKPIRARLRLTGHILRMQPERLVYKAGKVIFHDRVSGDILADVPEVGTWQELIDLAADTDDWKNRVRELKILQSHSE